MVDIEDIPAEVLNAATVQSSPVLAPGDIIDISVGSKKDISRKSVNKGLKSSSSTRSLSLISTTPPTATNGRLS